MLRLGDPHIVVVLTNSPGTAHIDALSGRSGYLLRRCREQDVLTQPRRAWSVTMARPALAHRQRCRTQSRCRSGLRENGDGEAQRGTPPLRRSHSTGDALAQPSWPFCLGQASPRREDPCVVALFEADSGGGPSPSLTPTGQRAAGVVDNSPCGCVLPGVWRMRVSVPRFPGTSQTAVSNGGATHRSERAAGCGYKMGAATHSIHPRGQGPRKAKSRERTIQAHTARGAKPHPGHQGTRKHEVCRQRGGIAASGIQTMRRTSGFPCCRISSAITSATRVVCVAVSDAQRQKLLLSGDVEPEP
ncbi:hypothetical protein TcBrA4_0069240 [Trypanosoma cruzi]|nr:hypothetical protein TcBrA4_0069240 [Trypanosoma cruzi]